MAKASGIKLQHIEGIGLSLKGIISVVIDPITPFDVSKIAAQAGIDLLYAIEPIVDSTTFPGQDDAAVKLVEVRDGLKICLNKPFADQPYKKMVSDLERFLKQIQRWPA